MCFGRNPKDDEAEMKRESIPWEDHLYKDKEERHRKLHSVNSQQGGLSGTENIQRGVKGWKGR